MMQHRSERRALFTPFCVPRGPRCDEEFEMQRLTVCQDKAGETFVVTDNWRLGENAHRVLDFGWTGCTYFKFKSAEDCLEQCASDVMAERAQRLVNVQCGSQATELHVPVEGDCLS